MNKKLIAGLISMTAVLPMCGMVVFADEAGVTINDTNFPDYNFQHQIRNYDKDSNGILSDSEISAVTELKIDNLAICTLKGIEHFTSLEELDCSGNHLTALDVSGLTNLESLDCSNNSNLSSVRVLQGVTVTAGDNTTVTKLLPIDDTNFPDDNFRSYVSDNFDTDNDEYLSDDEISCVTEINVGEMDIISLEGIEYFSGLEVLDCHGNILTSLDLSSNLALESLDCYENNLTSLDLSSNLTLGSLDCHNNSIAELNLGNNKVLRSLKCEDNSLTVLDLSHATALKYLECEDNLITSLNLRNNTNLKSLSCNGNDLTSLNVSNNKALESLDFDGDNITGIDLSNNIHLKTLMFGGENITDIDLSYNSELANLFIVQTGITSIDLSNNPYLTDLCSNYEYSYLDYPYNGSTRTFAAWNNGSESSPVIMCIDKNIAVISNGEVLYGEITPTPTVTPTATPTEAPKSGMVAFAERLYTEALNRNYDKAGRDYWVSQLRSGVSGAEVARQFFFSDEFVNANLSDSVFVDRLYRTFMDREADEAGKTYWMTQLSSGAMTREDVFNGFINSPEWANLCLKSGIVSGGTQAPTITVEPSEAVTSFATRLYTTCLGREADAAGVSWWANELANMRRTGTTAAQGFFFSDEYAYAEHSDAEFVTALYSTFMDRAYDQAGYDYWMGELSNGCTRENVLERFAACDEFGNICADAGIIR